MATTNTDVVAAPFLKALAQALPPEIAEVLLPSLRLRANASRLVVVVPNRPNIGISIPVLVNAAAKATAACQADSG